jgi:hypothetical protein
VGTPGYRDRQPAREEKTWPCTRGARCQKFAGAGTRNEFRLQPPPIKHHARPPCDQPRRPTTRNPLNNGGVPRWPGLRRPPGQSSRPGPRLRRSRSPLPGWRPVSRFAAGSQASPLGAIACRSATWSCTRTPVWRRTGSGSRTLPVRSPRCSSSRPRHGRAPAATAALCPPLAAEGVARSLGAWKNAFWARPAAPSR